MKNHSREQLLNMVNEVSFAVDDIKLYLDTHPTDAHALAALKNALAERKAAVAAYEEAHGALTHDGLLASMDYDWVERPFPFE